MLDAVLAAAHGEHVRHVSGGRAIGVARGTIRPGFPVRVIITRDLVLQPYRDWGGNMQKLRLGLIEDDKPARLAIELPAALQCELVAHGEAFVRETGQGPAQPAKLVAPMLARFMAADRAFAKARRQGAPRPPKQLPDCA